MTPDMKRLCACFADPGLDVFGVLTDGEREAIVRAVLTELREMAEQSPRFMVVKPLNGAYLSLQAWPLDARENTLKIETEVPVVTAMIDHILAEPTAPR